MKENETKVLKNSVKSNAINHNFGRGRGRGDSFKEKVSMHCGKNWHTINVCYRKHGYPPSWETGKGSANANNVGSDFQETDIELKMKDTNKGNISLTHNQYNGLIALLEKNGIDGTKYGTNMVRGESSSCYFARVASKHPTHESKPKDSNCN